MANTFDELFTSDPDKAVNGIPVPVGINQNNEKVIFWIAEAGNEKHEKVQRKYSEDLELARNNDVLYREILVKIVAESLLVKWSGVLDDNGEELAPTLENKIAALTQYRKLYHKVMDIATSETKFKAGDSQRAKADTRGNSSRP